MPKVRLNSYETNFWRHQKVGKNCLATIEAIYYFYKEYNMALTGKYNGEYDNLLYFFVHYYKMIQNEYKTEKKLFPRKPEYVQIENKSDNTNTEEKDTEKEES